MKALIDRANSDLASGWAIFPAARLTMIARYCDSRIPREVIPEDKLLLAKRTGVDTDETTIAGFIEHARDQFLLHFDSLAFSKALETAWSVVARVDKMITDAKPWDLAKDENQKQTLGAVLYRAAESLRWLSVLLYPVMPERAGRFGTSWASMVRPASRSQPSEVGQLKEGAAIGEVQPVFPRIDKAKIMAEINAGAAEIMSRSRRGSAAAPATQPAPPMTHATEADAVGVTSFIEIDDFAKVDLRVGQVLSAERIPKADKLLLMKVDLGEEQPRQILAGIAQYYEPEKLIGRKVVIVANLKATQAARFRVAGNGRRGILR